MRGVVGIAFASLGRLRGSGGYTSFPIELTIKI